MFAMFAKGRQADSNDGPSASSLSIRSHLIILSLRRELRWLSRYSSIFRMRDIAQGIYSFVFATQVIHLELVIRYSMSAFLDVYT